MKKTLLLTIFLSIGKFQLNCQCDFKPLGPSDTSQIAYNDAGYSKMVIDAGGTPYVVHSTYGYGCHVKKYNGSSWVTVGAENFSTASTAYTDIAIDPAGNLYVAYADYSLSGKCTIKKYNGSAWVNLGTQGFSTNQVTYVNMAIDPSGTPYVVYKDNSKANVKKYNGTSWVTVGVVGFSAGNADFTDIVIDATGTPFVVYKDVFNGSKATVMKYDGTAWVNVGTAGFSAGQADHTSIAIDLSGTLYVSYKDGGNASKAPVMKYNGSSWVNVGTAGFSDDAVDYISLTVDATGTPFVAYKDIFNSLKATVMKYNGTGWVNVGAPGFSAGKISYTDITIGAAGWPYVVYVDEDLGIDVMQFNGTVWTSMATKGFTQGGASYVQVATDRNNIPYVVFKDHANGGKCSVMKYTGSNWVYVGNAGFSPVSIFRADIAIDNNGTPYVLFDSLGSATVMKYNGTSWINVGPVGFLLGSISSGYNMEIDGAGMPYIVYNRVVMKFNGTSWINLSTVEFSNWADPKIAISPNDSIYIVGLDDIFPGSDRISVKKYTGTNWISVGNPISSNWSKYPDITVDQTGLPYVSYVDGATYDITVIRYDGSVWVNCGSTGTDAYSEIKLALDKTGFPYVVYSDAPNSDKATVKKYNGTNWSILGSAGFTAGQVTGDLSITIDNNNSVYTVYSNLGSAWVFKYNGNAVSANNALVCAGSNILLNSTGSGTSIYSWSGPNGFSSGVASPTITNSQAINSGIYSVTITDGTCVNTQTVSVNVDPTCADVWPGDANSDGIANNLDILELGLHYTQTGPARTTTSNSWQSCIATNWSGTITNGKNLNHNDCNGDGTINDNDTLAIYTNYGSIHTFRGTNQTVTNPQLSIVPDQLAVAKGNWGTSSIYLGDAGNPVSNVNGIAFTINFDNSLIEADSVWIEYPASFINTPNQNLKFRKLDFVNNSLYTAITHTVSNNVSGNGLIATLHYQIKSSLTTDEVLNLGIVQANQSDANGSVVPLTSGTGTLMAMESSVGIKEFSTGSIHIYPNPAKDVLTVQSSNEFSKVELMNVTGQVLLSEDMRTNTYQLNLSSVAKGIYLVNIYQNDKIISRNKIVVAK